MCMCVCVYVCVCMCHVFTIPVSIICFARKEPICGTMSAKKDKKKISNGNKINISTKNQHSKSKMEQKKKLKKYFIFNNSDSILRMIIFQKILT